MTRADLSTPSMPGRPITGLAAELVRGWLRAEPAAIDAEISAIGRAAVERSAAEIARHAGNTTRADPQALATLDAIAALLDPAPPPSRGWFGQRQTAPPPPDVAALVRTIEAERDAALRATLVLETDRARLAAADAALADAVALATMLEQLVAAAAREVARDRPDRAALLRGDVAAAIAVRRRDLVAQAAVLGHAMQAAELSAASESALIEALDRARTLSVGAVQTAISARRAVTSPDVARPVASVPDAVDRLNAAIARRARD